ncbi:MAG: cytochrome c peroxidase, partial [Syntrophales bacterium]|nr:cytochrome c peroxidase [Syntrophales bacterium]
LIQMLRDPYTVPLTGGYVQASITRRPGFGVTMPPLNVWSLDYNFLTGQPMRLRVSDGEVSWSQPGPLFDPNEVVPVNEFNVPTALRTVIGSIVVDGDNNLVISNPGGNPAIPPDGTLVAVPAVQGGVLNEMEDGVLEPVVELEIPVNEEDFFRPTTDTAGVPANLIPLIGRPAAEILGKALFWDMQVGSDGVQACGSCHFHGGADNRVRGQLNPDTLGPDGNLATLEVQPPNTAVVASDFPFHKAGQDVVGGPLDKNDVMSSMGVSIFKQFVDIPTPGPSAFIGVPGLVRPLKPDIGIVMPDPVPVNQGFRRVEPRNTPTFHNAAFNFDNFWDGRARFHFNGGSVQGPSDPTAHIFIDQGGLQGATNGMVRPDLDPTDDQFNQPVRIKFSSLASQAVGPPLSNFEMSFDGRNWAKIGKKLLQAGVTPLANQMVSTTDSLLGPYSNQQLAGTRPGITGPGLSLTYNQLIELAFRRDLWESTTQHLNGAPDPTDPFDGYSLTVAAGAASPTDTNQFTQMEANFSLFFGLAVQAYESLTIADHTPFDQFMDANPLAANGIGEAGAQEVLFPTLVPGLVGGSLTLIPPTAEHNGFGPDEIFGFDIFAGGNLTAGLPPGSPRNPLQTVVIGDAAHQVAVGSNPFSRTARCMQCHLGPEQTDHSINISHGLIKNDAEFEFPTPPTVPEPTGIYGTLLTGVAGTAPAPEPPGPFATVGGLILTEELEGMAQDAVEVEPRNFATFDNPATPWDDRIIAQPQFFAFGDQGIYNVGVRPVNEDIGRGDNDPFGWPLSLSALTLKNIGGPAFEPNDSPTENNLMPLVDPANLGATFVVTGANQLVNPGFERSPITPLMPAYMVPWINDLPAGELHPQIDEMAGMAPNTITPPNGGPAIEFPEVLFGSDLHCGLYDPAQFGTGPPSFGWGPTIAFTGPNPCPNNQSGVANNFAFPVHGTWPVSNRVLRNGAFKAPQLRNVELTGPYFHTGSYLTLRQVVDFYLRGGDFPNTNADNRDPHMMNIDMQAFGFGTTNIALIGDVPPGGITVDGVTYAGTFADALPDPQFQYGFFPDNSHPLTPEPFASRAAALEDVRNALVKFLLALTDPRVKFEKAPFDHPEIFVSIDGAAPENVSGRDALLANSVVFNTAAPPPGTTAQFKRVPEVGAAGNPTPLVPFLNANHFNP